jgi:NADPH-dependent 2,4-dienoyl-CoA reductase/sulfur reductase-like enzyme
MPPDNGPVDVDLLIVGGGPAALSAATGYRDAGGEGSVLLVSDEDVPPYFRPPLSKDYLWEETAEEELALQSPSRYGELAVSTRLGDGVVELDPRAAAGAAARRWSGGLRRLCTRHRRRATDVAGPGGRRPRSVLPAFAGECPTAERGGGDDDQRRTGTAARASGP